MQHLTHADGDDARFCTCVARHASLRVPSCSVMQLKLPTSPVTHGCMVSPSQSTASWTSAANTFAMQHVVLPIVTSPREAHACSSSSCRLARLGMIPRTGTLGRLGNAQMCRPRWKAVSAEVSYMDTRKAHILLFRILFCPGIGQNRAKSGKIGRCPVESSKFGDFRGPHN